MGGAGVAVAVGSLASRAVGCDVSSRRAGRVDEGLRDEVPASLGAERAFGFGSGSGLRRTGARDVEGAGFVLRASAASVPERLPALLAVLRAGRVGSAAGARVGGPAFGVSFGRTTGALLGLRAGALLGLFLEAVGLLFVDDAAGRLAAGFAGPAFDVLGFFFAELAGPDVGAGLRAAALFGADCEPPFEEGFFCAVFDDEPSFHAGMISSFPDCRDLDASAESAGLLDEVESLSALRAPYDDESRTRGIRTDMAARAAT